MAEGGAVRELPKDLGERFELWASGIPYELAFWTHWATTRGGAWQPQTALAQLVIGPPELIAAAAEAVATRLAGLYAVSFPVSFLPGNHAMLVRMRGPSKGTALGELCAHYGVSLDEAVVAGDWWNDVPMFEVAGRSFAMPGAPQEVKALATDRLPSGATVADLIDLCWS